MRKIPYLLITLISIIISSCNPDKPINIEEKARKQKITMRDMSGVNAFEWDFLQNPNNPNRIDSIYEPQMEMIKSFGAVRHYLDWEKLEDREGSYTFNPTRRGGWNYDLIYERCKQDSIEVLSCIKNSPDWMHNTYPEDQRDGESIPAPYGEKTDDPASYIAMGKVAFQFAARYGKNKNVDSTLLSVNGTRRWTGDSINAVKIGLGLVNYVECNNEPDKWWKGKKAQQDGRMYAANLSAFYDGHKGKLGKGVGVKNADPTMKVVMGGLARADVKFVREMVEWCKENRGFKPDGSVDLCFDVINYHLYSNDNTGWFSKFTSKKRGVAPELNSMGDIADSFVTYAASLGPDIQVWSTELGYDLNKRSVQRAIPIGNKSALLTQADWILRSSLLYARHGVSKLFFYQLFDYDAPGANSGGPFGSSGLIDRHKRRPAADYLLQVNKLMGNYSYDRTINKDPFVDVYALDKKEMYVLVVPDEVDRREEYTLDLRGAKEATIYTLKPGADKMDSRTVKTNGGSVKVTVTETPMFIQGN